MNPKLACQLWTYLAAVLHVVQLNPRLEGLLGGKFEHILALLLVADMSYCKVRPIGSEGLQHEFHWVIGHSLKHHCQSKIQIEEQLEVRTTFAMTPPTEVNPTMSSMLMALAIST